VLWRRRVPAGGATARSKVARELAPGRLRQKQFDLGENEIAAPQRLWGAQTFGACSGFDRSQQRVIVQGVSSLQAGVGGARGIYAAGSECL
jgi:hypothetical protein